MKKNILIVYVLVFVLTFIPASLSFGMEEDIKSVDEVMTEIQNEQGVSDYSSIDIDKVSDELLEELGDSVMEFSIGNSSMHERMDRQLGGEDSKTLTEFHENVGYAYLMGDPNPVMSIMMSPSSNGSGMMRFDNVYRRGNGMMGYPGYYGGMMGYRGIWSGVAGVVILVLIVVAIYFIFKLFTKKDSAKIDPYISQNLTENPIDIAKIRFAKGEITEDEYDKIINKIK